MSNTTEIKSMNFLSTIPILLAFLMLQVYLGVEGGGDSINHFGKVIIGSTYIDGSHETVYKLWGVHPVMDPKMARHLLDKICQVPQKGHSGYHPDNTEGLDEEMKKTVIDEGQDFKDIWSRWSVYAEKEGGVGRVFPGRETPEQNKLIEFAKEIILSYYRLHIYRRSLEAMINGQFQTEHQKKEMNKTECEGLVKEIDQRLPKIASAFPGDMTSIKNTESYVVLVLGRGNTLPPGKDVPLEFQRKYLAN
ncbi:hypothetical protein DdX_12994 [Ditylenchus destructor]|uniref:Uncharacterized protein n=1 Tax=Ditylenchus destructor TaxID=166010 RepID=A0AAD4MZJ9_9BILA|nr:hypothetical protein DdX_12994 [Ditylenchus destructor]